MGTIVIAKTQIQGQGKIEGCRRADAVVHAHHKLGCPGKGRRRRRAEADRDQGGFWGDAFITSLAGISVSGGDAGDGSAVAASVLREGSACAQGFIDLLWQPFAAHGISGRRIADGRLIPEADQTGGAVAVLKIRMGQSEAGIHDSHQNPLTIQVPGGLIKGGDAGRLSGLDDGEKKTLWFFYKCDIGQGR